MFVVAPSVIGSIVLTIILIFKIFSGSIKFMDIFSKTIKEIIPSYHFGKIEILLYAELTPFYFYIITVIIVLIFNTIYYAMIGAESESIKKD
jgi:ABC-type glucose/galactose transport system permease subunit